MNEGMQIFIVSRLAFITDMNHESGGKGKEYETTSLLLIEFQRTFLICGYCGGRICTIGRFYAHICRIYADHIGISDRFLKAYMRPFKIPHIQEMYILYFIEMNNKINGNWSQ